MNKVSTIEVLKDSLALFMDRKLTYLTLFAVPAVFATVNVVIGAKLDNDPATADVNLGLSVGLPLAYMFFMSLYMMFCCHYSVTHIRGTPRIMPAQVGKRLAKMFLYSMKILALIVLAIIATTVLGFPLIELLTAGTGHTTFVLYAVGIPVGAVVLTLFFRTSFAMVGISVGELHKLREALRLSQGYSVPIFFVCVLIIIPGAIDSIPGLTDSLRVGPLFIAILFLSNLITQIASVIIFCVWYEKLLPGYRERVKADGLSEIVGEKA